MADIMAIAEFDLRQENLIPFLSSQPILAQILRELILDRVVAQIEYNPSYIVDLPEDASQAAIAIRQYKIQQFKIQQWGNQLGQYFLQRKRQLDQVVYSIIRTSDPGLTQELYFRIQAQEASIADLAQTYSQGPEALTNGVIGPVKVASLPSQIAQKLAGMQPGKVAAPIRLQDEFVIFKLERWLPAQMNDITKQMLLNELFENWLREQITQKLPQFSQSQKSCHNSAQVEMAA